MFHAIFRVVVQVCKEKVCSEITPVLDFKLGQTPKPHVCGSLGNQSGSKEQGNVGGRKKKCVYANERDIR